MRSMARVSVEARLSPIACATSCTAAHTWCLDTRASGEPAPAAALAGEAGRTLCPHSHVSCRQRERGRSGRAAGLRARGGGASKREPHLHVQHGGDEERHEHEDVRVQRQAGGQRELDRLLHLCVEEGGHDLLWVRRRRGGLLLHLCPRGGGGHSSLCNRRRDRRFRLCTTDGGQHGSLRVWWVRRCTAGTHGSSGG